MEARKNSLYLWVIEAFPYYSYDRAKRSGPLLNDFDSYDDFKIHQHATIYALDDTSLTFFERLRDFIPNTSITSRKYSGFFDATGFIFIRGRCVIPHER